MSFVGDGCDCDDYDCVDDSGDACSCNDVVVDGRNRCR
jgi:hypothetical protein